jgi:hypothetical protein
VTRASLAVALVVLSLACGRRAAPPPAPAPAEPAPVRVSAWEVTIDSARNFLLAGHYAEADGVLRRFGAVADSAEAAEAEFWRAMLRADPTTSFGDAQVAVTSLEAYLARGSRMPRFAEALLLRRMLAAADSLRGVIAANRQVFDARDRLREDSLAKLVKDLEATKAELDRIKKRLTKP